MTPAEIDGLRRYLRQALADVLELAGATRSERDHRLYGALVRVEWASTALLDAPQLMPASWSLSARTQSRTPGRFWRRPGALSALVAAVADSVERRLDAVETGCE